MWLVQQHRHYFQTINLYFRKRILPYRKYIVDKLIKRIKSVILLLKVSRKSGRDGKLCACNVLSKYVCIWWHLNENTKMSVTVSFHHRINTHVTQPLYRNGDMLDRRNSFFNVLKHFFLLKNRYHILNRISIKISIN